MIDLNTTQSSIITLKCSMFKHLIKNTITEMKNAFGGFISRLEMVKNP